MDLSYLIVNTNGGTLLGTCLDAVFADMPSGVRCEVIVLDNASDDGSQVAAQREGVRLMQLASRTGKAANDSQMLREAHGKYCLLLNEDSELVPGASAALIAALDGDDTAGTAGAQLLDGDGVAQPCAWRFPTARTALAQALVLHKRFVVQSGGTQTTQVDWAQSAALMVRREAAASVNFLDTDFFVYADEVDFCKRLADAGWHTLYVPSASCFHREGLSHGDSARRRIVEYHRGRELYMRKHHNNATRLTVRALTAWTYALRAVGALVLRRHSAQRFMWHVQASLRPSKGEGLREAAAHYNNAHS